jgi:predicted metal-binding protein
MIGTSFVATEFHFAMGFGGGSCRIVLCKDKGCQVLQEGTCRFPLRSRPSMESCAMDVYRTVTNAGWTIYPLGSECNVSEVKHGTIVGLVLIE